MKLTQFLLVATACVVSFSTAAQWQWIDKDGRKVFSDRPPSSDVPDKNIIKQPNIRTRVSDEPVTPVVPGSVAPKLGDGVDKSLMEKKKQTESAEAAKRKADEDRIASAKADNCIRARQTKANLDSGSRISKINEKGEREFMDEAARSAESQRIQGTIDADCR
jgi:Domain of unknown function (DUF4124)